METTTPFDLNRAIQQWQENLAQSPAIRRENLDELETHLRDSIATLQSRDLSAEEAFLIATRRVGSDAVLGKEFGKVNVANMWVERGLWALVAMQIWSAMQTLFGAYGLFLQLAKHFSINSVSGWEAAVWIVALSATPLVACALIFWRLFKSPESWFGRFLENLSTQPVNLAALLFVLSAAGHLSHAYMLDYSNHTYGGTSWVAYTYFLPGSLCYAGLIFFLARKRLLRKA